MRHHLMNQAPFYFVRRSNFCYTLMLVEKRTYPSPNTYDMNNCIPKKITVLSFQISGY